MLHKYQSLQESSDRMLWDRIENDKKRLLKWAKEKKTSCIDGEKANALHVLYNYYMGGWCGLPINIEIAKKCLKESAELGHAKAIYDFTRDALGTPEIQQAKIYICQALEQDKLSDTRFDFEFNNYKQGSMKQELEGLLNLIEATNSMRIREQLVSPHL